MIKVTFPGGKKVYAQIGEFTVETDQPVEGGGEGTAPAPFAVFLSSIGTCAGIYALGFCQSRGINTEGMSIDMDFEGDNDNSTGLISKVILKLNTPEGFPKKYEAGVIRSMELCAVKKHFENPPKFVTLTDLADKGITE